MLRILKVVTLVVVCVPLLTGVYMGVQQLLGNFHEVIPGELYRSGQPSGADIRRYSKEFGVKTVINLRDERRGPWYTEELAAVHDRGMTQIDFPISSGEKLDVRKAELLARIMKSAEKPILIHCEHGANRTGLASAIYVGAVAGRSETFSEFQLSPYYGHVPIKGIGRYEMYASWDEFEETIGF